MNSYLSPLVNELKEGYNVGFNVNAPNGAQVTIYVMLSCITCNIPALRNVCGFLSHNSKLGCNKCLKVFEGAPGEHDYSGFDRSMWTMRNCSQHRESCNKILLENTKTNIRNAEAKFGCRVSVLLLLEYFDPVRFVVIDIMHNLYLGTAKHFFKSLISDEILTPQKLKEIDHLCSAFIVPENTGRLPLNMSSNYGGFKASQWCTWVTVYSAVVLKDLIPNDHLRCWLLYVRACSIISQRFLKKSDIATVDALLVELCCQFERVFGKENCTMNMHLHLHIKECLHDFGPAHTTWCFPFERYNGLLGSFPTNNKGVEIQFMKKFLDTQSIHFLSREFEASEIYYLLPTKKCNSTSSLGNMMIGDELIVNIFNLSRCLITSLCNHFFASNTLIKCLPPYYDSVFDYEQLQQLKLTYQQLYPHLEVTRLSPFFVRVGRVSFCDEVIGSVLNCKTANSSSVIGAYWPGSGNHLPTTAITTLRIGVIQFFVKHLFTPQLCQGSEVEHIFAFVLWKKLHRNRDFFGISAQVCSTTSETPSPCSFLPVLRIACKCAHLVTDVNMFGSKEHVYIAIPIPLKFNI